MGLGVLGGKLQRQEESAPVQEGGEKVLLPSCLHCASGVQESAPLSSGVRRVDLLAEVTGVAPGSLSRPRASGCWGAWGAVKGTSLLRRLVKVVAAVISVPYC